MISKAVTIYTSGDSIPGILNLPGKNGKFPVIVFNNGYCAYHEMYDELSAKFCDNGFATLEYEPRGSAGARHGYQFCGTEWLDDVTAAVSYVYGLNEIDSDRIALAGVSMGGATTLIQGSRDSRIKCLFAMAPFLNGEINIKQRYIAASGEDAWNEFFKKLLDNSARVARGFESELMPENVSAFTGQYGEPDEEEILARYLHPLKIDRLPLESILNVYLHVDALAAAEKIQIPTLLIHGTKDETLEYDGSLKLFEALACKEKEFHPIEGAGHVLPEVALDEVYKYGLDWFLRYL